MNEDLKTENPSTEIKVVQTDSNAKNGQAKCPKCGATDISTNISSGKLRCNFCRHEFEPEKITGLEEDLTKLSGQVIASGAQNIKADVNDVLTFKCSSCGAEVVIDTASSTNARCHWCRNILTVNQQIENGSIPDVVLPFGVTRDDAKKEIEKFVGKRKFFANPTFKKEFVSNNVMGVYFPYMLVDANTHANFSGEGEHETRRYFRGSDEHKQQVYDADLYHVEREFDLTITGLSIESSKDKLNNTAKDKTNNIINAIMPFDVENCVKYSANYLVGYTSEKRDTNIDDLKDVVYEQSKDIARYAANDILKQYDRGVRWSTEDFEIKGQQWKAAYLPVWLYSYQEVKKNKKILHYVAVNARTKETMGSVPIHIPLLLGISALIELLCVLLVIFVDWQYRYIFLVGGFIYYLIIYTKYRNNNARHTYEKETKKEMSNLRQKNDFIKHETGLTNSYIIGVNNNAINGSHKSILSNVATKTNINGVNVGDVINKTINKK